MRRLIFIVLFFILCGGASVKAQCIDSNIINQFYNCGTLFEPVCACDGKTYRNACSARNHGGIYDGYWTDGVCDLFFFDILPVPTQGYLSFVIQFRDPYSSASILIYDMYGTLSFQQSIVSLQKLEMGLNLQHLRTGMYVMWVVSGNNAKYKKFIKFE